MLNLDWSFMGPDDVIVASGAVYKHRFLCKFIWLVEAINLSGLSISSVSFLLNLVGHSSCKLRGSVSNFNLRQMLSFKLQAIEYFSIVVENSSSLLYARFIIDACAQYFSVGPTYTIIMKIYCILHRRFILLNDSRIIS